MSGVGKVATCIWVEKGGLEAARFWTGLIPGSEVSQAHKFEHMDMGEEGVALIEFTLAGTPYQVLQAGPHQEHNDMMSIVVLTDDQAETDRIWAGLTGNGGREVQCGWLKDRWGVSWQIVPRRMTELMASGEKSKIAAMHEAMYKMKKLEMADLEAAYNAG